MLIAIFETEDWERQACARLQGEHTLVCTKAAADESTVGEYINAEVVSVFVNSRLDASVLTRFHDLQLIATRSTGYDHIDLDYCRAHRISVCNVPSYGDTTVAEHSFALMLAVSRKLIESVERTRRGRFDTKGLRGFDLRGKRLGVIGAGRIGTRVIEIANGFGMDVIAFDAMPSPELAQRLGFSYAAFDEVLARADIVSLHVPATKDTYHLISDPQFGIMKPGSVLINTARGNVVDIPALVRALSSGQIGGAGLDVLPHERILHDEAEIFRQDTPEVDVRSVLASNVLLQMSNVVVTPHNAFNTDDAVQRIIDTTLKNIEAFASGHPLNVVA